MTNRHHDGMNSTVHENFDEPMWSQRYPLAKLRREAREFVVNRRKEFPQQYTDESFERHVELMMPQWEPVFCPSDLVVCTQLRREVYDRLKRPDGAIRTDVFVWCQGEPANRALTKVGGLPYWPVNRDWPMDDSPMRFVAQFNFSDSLDLLPELPGTILCVFCRGAEFYGADSDLHCEWVSVADTPLVSTVPAQGWWSEGVVHGQRYRTWDHPELGVFQATKIAGIPGLIQGDLELPGIHLATLHSMNFYANDRRFPFANRETPLEPPERDNYFMVGDVGSIHLFIDEHGAVRGTAESY